MNPLPRMIYAASLAGLLAFSPGAGGVKTASARTYVFSASPAPRGERIRERVRERRNAIARISREPGEAEIG